MKLPANPRASAPWDADADVVLEERKRAGRKKCPSATAVSIVVALMGQPDVRRLRHAWEVVGKDQSKP